jgi:hypothetical protein
MHSNRMKLIPQKTMLKTTILADRLAATSKMRSIKVTVPTGMRATLKTAHFEQDVLCKRKQAFFVAIYRSSLRVFQDLCGKDSPSKYPTRPTRLRPIVPLYHHRWKIAGKKSLIRHRANRGGLR